MKYDKIFLIGNPIAGGGALKKLKKAELILKTKGIPFETLLTKKKGDGELFATRIRENEKDRILVIAAGGDGTYNEIANGLVYSTIPLAILPMGTTSVLAKELKIPKDIKKAIELAINGPVTRVHLGKIKNKEKERFFLLMAGIGFDGLAVYNVDLKKKKHLRKLAYLWSGIKTLITYKPLKLKIHNGVSLKAYTVVISKASCYGGDFKIAPDITLQSPFFSVFVSKTKSRIRLAQQILGVIFGKHLGMKETEYFRTESLRILGDSHVQIDGDYFGKTPVQIRIVKNALSLVCPE